MREFSFYGVSFKEHEQTGEYIMRVRSADERGLDVITHYALSEGSAGEVAEKTIEAFRRIVESDNGARPDVSATCDDGKVVLSATNPKKKATIALEISYDSDLKFELDLKMGGKRVDVFKNTNPQKLDEKLASYLKKGERKKSARLPRAPVEDLEVNTASGRYSVVDFREHYDT